MSVLTIVAVTERTTTHKLFSAQKQSLDKLHMKPKIEGGSNHVFRCNGALMIASLPRAAYTGNTEKGNLLLRCERLFVYFPFKTASIFKKSLWFFEQLVLATSAAGTSTFDHS